MKRHSRVNRRFAGFSASGLCAEYARLPAGAGRSVTRSHAIGVAFTPQRHAEWTVGGNRRARSFEGSAVFIVPADRLEWSEWTDTSESVEMWLRPRLVRALSLSCGGPSRITFDYHEAIHDPVVVNIASAVRALLLGGRDAARWDHLAVRLTTHLLERYCAVRPPPTGFGRLDLRTLDRVAEFIAAHLDQPISIAQLSRIADRSPWHFAKVFAATTGSPPHADLNARRMESALVLLQQTGLPIRHIARLVGFTSLNHFRSRFRRAWGEPTQVYRQAGRPRATV